MQMSIFDSASSIQISILFYFRIEQVSAVILRKKSFWFYAFSEVENPNERTHNFFEKIEKSEKIIFPEISLNI